MATNYAAMIDFAVKGAQQVRAKPPKWTPAEDAFLAGNLGFMTEAEIGRALGRSVQAVHIRWSRELDLGAPSKDPNYISANRAADVLGVDAHKLTGWVDMGLIPARIMAGSVGYRLIDRQAFRRWVLNPMNWPYFDPARVRDPELKRMLKKRAKRWGDEWWSTRQVADYHGVTVQDVKRYIAMGRVESYRLPYSLSGRHRDRAWSNHFILKSLAIKMKFNRDRRLNAAIKWSPAADAWILKAYDQLGMTFVQIGRTMKMGHEKCNPKTGTPCGNPTIAKRYHQLKQIRRPKKSRP